MPEPTQPHTHRSDGNVYTSNPPQLRCKDCGEYFTFGEAAQPNKKAPRDRSQVRGAVPESIAQPVDNKPHHADCTGACSHLELSQPVDGGELQVEALLRPYDLSGKLTRNVIAAFKSWHQRELEQAEITAEIKGLEYAVAPDGVASIPERVTFRIKQLQAHQPKPEAQ